MGDLRPEPFDVIAQVCKHHLAIANAGKQFSGCLVVVSPAELDQDLRRQVTGVGRGIDLKRLGMVQDIDLDGSFQWPHIGRAR